MSKKKTTNNEEAQSVPTDVETPPESVADAPDVNADAPDDPPRDPLAELKAENEQLKDKNLRLVAELANTRQRAERERLEGIRYAEAEFAKDLLVVLDDLERILQGMTEKDTPAPETEGLRILRDQFLKVLATHKIAPVAAAGAPFNPDYHEALLQQPSPNVPAGTVIQELQKGYTMHDRVIRPARVIVSSGSAAGNEE